MADRYFVDLNPSFGAWKELRYVIIDRKTGRQIPRAIGTQYSDRRCAFRRCEQLNIIEAEAEADSRFSNAMSAERRAGSYCL